MKPNKFNVISAVFFMLLLLQVPLTAEITSTEDIRMPTPSVMENNTAIAPYFYISAQIISSMGYNLENNAYGFKPAEGWASFSFGLVDAKYNNPRQVDFKGDPEYWSGSFSLKNFTHRLHSYDEIVHYNFPIYIAQIEGKGFHFGLHGQGGEYIKDSDSMHTLTLYGGRQVLFFEDPSADDPDYYDNSFTNSDINPETSASYAGSGIIYAGYEKENLFKTYLSVTTEGSVDDGSADGNGAAAVLDTYFTPMGTSTDYMNPFTLAISANVIGGYNFNSGNPLGFGLKVEPSLFIADDIVAMPVAAFDAAAANGDFSQLKWSAGGGLKVRLSGMMWGGNTMGGIEDTDTNYYGAYYENTQYLKYSYAQLYASFSEAENLDLAIKFEEPFGLAGFHQQMGSVIELRVNNLLNTNGVPLEWSAMGRINYSLQQERFTPYLRSYIDSEDVLKLRTGLQINVIPRAGFEISYLSEDLNNGGADPMDKGRVEFTVILGSDRDIARTPMGWDDTMD